MESRLLLSNLRCCSPLPVGEGLGRGPRGSAERNADVCDKRPTSRQQKDESLRPSPAPSTAAPGSDATRQGHGSPLPRIAMTTQGGQRPFEALQAPQKAKTIRFEKYTTLFRHYAISRYGDRMSCDSLECSPTISSATARRTCCRRRVSNAGAFIVFAQGTASISALDHCSAFRAC